MAWNGGSYFHDMFVVMRIVCVTVNLERFLIDANVCACMRVCLYATFIQIEHTHTLTLITSIGYRTIIDTSTATAERDHFTFFYEWFSFHFIHSADFDGDVEPAINIKMLAFERWQWQCIESNRMGQTTNADWQRQIGLSCDDDNKFEENKNDNKHPIGHMFPLCARLHWRHQAYLARSFSCSFSSELVIWILFSLNLHKLTTIGSYRWTPSFFLSSS